ncbi:MAG: hypothetical protein ACM3YM_12470 [Sphingomonadales bacterium]
MAWQFQTTADKVNLAIIQDMIQKKKHGMYAAPLYVTNIDKQFNCAVSASSVGNNGTNSMVANSPSTNGAKSTATGNNNSTDVHTGDPGSTDVTGSQDNSGAVHSSIDGGTSTQVHGKAWQALNNTQTNSGDQTASVSGSTGCTFGPLN